MKSAVETLNPTRVKLTVEVPFEELKPNLDAAYKKIAQQINVPGFRRGKVPAPVIDQRIGRGVVLDEAVNDALPGLYAQALQDNDIVPLSQPEIDFGDFGEGQDLTFSAELDVKPSITLPDYDGLVVEVDDIEVGDEQVEEQVQALRERFATLTAVERPAADGDFVTIDLSAAKDGEAITEAQAAGMSYQVGRATMLEGLDEALAGMSAGDEKTFPSTLVGGEYKDQQVDVTVKVTGVKEQELPELDDEFAQTASEFDTLDELRADLRDRAERFARLEQAAAARDAVLEKLLTMVDIPIPDAAVAEEKQSRRDSITEQLSYAGVSEDDYLESEGKSKDEFDTDLDERVRNAIAAQFLLDDIANAEALGVNENELSEHMLRRAQQTGVSPQEYVQHAMEHNHVPELVAEVRRGKALAHIVESATVKDRSGNDVELKTLLPDGSYGEATESGTGTDAEPEGEPASAEAAAEQPAGDASATSQASSSDSASAVPLAGDYVTIEDDDG